MEVDIEQGAVQEATRLAGLSDWSKDAAASRTKDEDLSRAVSKIPRDVAVALCRAARERAPDMGAREWATVRLAEYARDSGDHAAIAELLRGSKPLFAHMPKARVAKLVRTLLDRLGETPGGERPQREVCREFVEWSKVEGMSYLRQKLQLRLCSLWLESREYAQALSGLAELLHELKKLDDKPQLVEALLLESHVHRALHSVVKAKSSLTTARTNANSIYCPPKLQAELDMQNGIINADEHDYKTAYSYFFEAFEGLETVGDQRSLAAWKCMLMARTMSGDVDLAGAMATKNSQKYADHPVTVAMRGIARSVRESSLDLFNQVREKHATELVGDPVVSQHLDDLYSTLLQKNLSRIIEPFSCVELSYIASVIKLPLEVVEKRLSQMILDKKADGILDQGAGTLILFDDPPDGRTHSLVVETIRGLTDVVDGLCDRATKLLA